MLLGLGTLFSVVLRFRLPSRKSSRKERVSVLFTNLLLVGVVLIAGWTMGWRTYLAIQLPVIWIAGVAGIWLFYVQHQFDGVYWARRGEWDGLRAAMEGEAPAEPRTRTSVVLRSRFGGPSTGSGSRA